MISVLLLSLPFRAAYAIGDVAQNTLLGMGYWPWHGARGVSALRLIGSGLAALLVSAAIGLLLKDGTHTAASTALMIVALSGSLALLSAWWLRQTLQPYAHVIAGAPAPPSAPRWQRDQLLPLAIIAALALALPTFTKLAPYLAQSRMGSAGWGSAVLIAYALGSVFVQPLAARWPTVAMRRLGVSGAALAALGLVFAMALSPHRAGCQPGLRHGSGGGQCRAMGLGTACRTRLAPRPSTAGARIRRTHRHRPTCIGSRQCIDRIATWRIRLSLWSQRASGVGNGIGSDDLRCAVRVDRLGRQHLCDVWKTPVCRSSAAIAPRVIVSITQQELQRLRLTFFADCNDPHQQSQCMQYMRKNLLCHAELKRLIRYAR